MSKIADGVPEFWTLALTGANSLTIQPLARKPLADDVHVILRQMIIRRQLAPGEKITEAGMAALLGVSRTPVREAFQRLCYEEFLIDRPGRSAQVSSVSAERVEEIYPLVAVLEGLAARLACPRLSDTDLRHMEALTREMALHARKGQTEKLVEADARFHGVLHERAENSHLHRVISELRLRTARLEYAFFAAPNEVKMSLRRHRKLVRVLRGGNARLAQKTLQQQWELGRQALLRIIEQGESGAPAALSQDGGTGIVVNPRSSSQRASGAVARMG